MQQYRIENTKTQYKKPIRNSNNINNPYLKKS